MRARGPTAPPRLCSATASPSGPLFSPTGLGWGWGAPRICGSNPGPGKPLQSPLGVATVPVVHPPSPGATPAHHNRGQDGHLDDPLLVSGAQVPAPGEAEASAPTPHSHP